MKKLIVAIGSIFLIYGTLHAQENNVAPSKEKLDLSNRANDHFMIQYGIDGWLNTPDSINPSGFSRHFNFYVMLDKPFRSSPHYSIGIGVGLGSSNIFFKNTMVDLKSATTTYLPFLDVSATSHYNKYKLTTIFAELPLEIRYAGNPVQPDKGLKIALGLKIGTLLKSYTKGKNLMDVNGTSIYGDKFIQKESNKRFINTTRFALTGRIGFGNFSLDGSYQVNGFLKENAGATFHPWSLGITVSGL
ncbi:MAG: outer membrane beta-barrel protein [Bacteroidetes bacterium]|nr:outer membrane beta-barrel protein [Bacteroidota bacterium]